jgi:hypothetical protein
MRRRFATAFALLAVTALAAVPASATVFNLAASLDCAQAAAGAGTCGGGGSGTGSATITFDDSSNLLSWTLTYSGLSAATTAAHFHGPALPSQNAGVQVNIGTANPAVGSATISASQASDLLAGLWYINVHTSNFSAGEIRGQVALVPEPAMLGLVGIGVAAALARRRRR